MNAPSRRRRKGNVHRAPYRERVEQLLREDRHTWDEIVETIRTEFPGEPVSRSALWRYGQPFQELMERMRELDRAAQTLVGELGDSIGEKAGTLLTNAVVTLVTDAALKQQQAEEVDIESVRKLARAAKDAIDSKRVDLNVRRTIAAEAREKVLAEQREKLDALGKSGAIDPATLAVVIAAAYGNGV